MLWYTNLVPLLHPSLWALLVLRDVESLMGSFSVIMEVVGGTMVEEILVASLLSKTTKLAIMSRLEV